MTTSSFPLGLIPIPIRPPYPKNVATTLPTLRMVIEVSQTQAILTTGNLAKLLKSKEALSVVNNKPWPPVMNTDDAPKKKLLRPYNPPTPELLAYVDFSVSTTGVLTGVKVRCTVLYLNFVVDVLVLHEVQFSVCQENAQNFLPCCFEHYSPLYV